MHKGAHFCISLLIFFLSVTNVTITKKARLPSLAIGHQKVNHQPRTTNHHQATLIPAIEPPASNEPSTNQQKKSPSAIAGRFHFKQKKSTVHHRTMLKFYEAIKLNFPKMLFISSSVLTSLSNSYRCASLSLASITCFLTLSSSSLALMAFSSIS